MSGWAAKRFWQAAAAQPCQGGFAIHLDGRPVKTPAKAALIVPSLALAQEIAAEWDAQAGQIRPETMPLTRYANSAIDKLIPQFALVADAVAAYGGSDLLCYRATGPEVLIARQAAAWDPLLDWAAREFGAPLQVTSGVIPIAQAPASLGALAGAVHALDPFALAALHDLVAIPGSLVLGLAVLRGRLDAAEAFALGRIDEDYQAEVWGQDEEANEIRSRKAADLSQAERFLRLLT